MPRASVSSVKTALRRGWDWKWNEQTADARRVALAKVVSGFSRSDVISRGRVEVHSPHFSAKRARSESTAALRLKPLTTFASAARLLSPSNETPLLIPRLIIPPQHGWDWKWDVRVNENCSVEGACAPPTLHVSPGPGRLRYFRFYPCRYANSPTPLEDLKITAGAPHCGFVGGNFGMGWVASPLLRKSMKPPHFSNANTPAARTKSISTEPKKPMKMCVL